MAFEAILSKQPVVPRSWRRLTIVTSLAVHGVALAAGAVHSLWQVDELPMPAIEVTLTDSPPPPPPPPPPRRRATPRKPDAVRKLATPRPDALVAPTEEVNKVLPEQEPEPEDSEADGVEGGVEGGVVGGVVGAAAPPPPPLPPPKKKGPEMVSAQVARGQLMINPGDPRYRVDLPPALARTGQVFTAMLMVCVSAEGKVTGVRVLSSAGPAIDPQFPRVIGRWRYRPLRLNGQPTPFCYRLRYQVSGG